MDIAPVFHPSRSKYLVITTDYLIPFFICISVIFLAYFILYSPFFQVTTIECVADYQPCKDTSIIAELDKLKGKNIFTLSQSVISTRLTSGDFTIREAKLVRELPDSVKMELQSVYPVVAIQVTGDTTWVVLDSKLRVIGTRTSDPNVPTIMISESLTLTVGKTITDEVTIKALSLARRLADERFSVKKITLIDEDTVKLSLNDGRSAIFTPKKDELDQLRILQAILADATMIKGVTTIDVRWAQPVLR